jgi:iron complex transport system ATP-binding protein
MMIKTENLTAGYEGGFHIRDINIQIGSGDFAGIIGPNGSGKTTLLKVFTKVIKPESGRILFDSEDINNLGFREAAQRFAVVPQSVEAGFVSVEDYVLMGRIPFYGRLQFFETEKDRRIAGGYMELTGVSSLRDKFMSEISGGERQLAAIARALTQEPRILFLDEPTSHLDIKHQVEILDLLAEMNSSRGITVVCVLHDLNLAGEYCSGLALMDGGKIFETGEPKEVLTYKTIEKVYDTVVVVTENPVSGKPYVAAVSGEAKKKARKQTNI